MTRADGALDADIIVVGYGPVGAVVAALLGASGLRVILLEREALAYRLPRATAADGEAMRLFQLLGVAEELLPKLNVSRNIRHINAKGELLLLLTRGGGPGPDGWQSAYRFYQPDLETVLRGAVAKQPTIDVRLRAEAFAIDEADDHVTVRYEDLSDSSLRSVTGRFVVGCDGARSTVRRFMGAALHDLKSHQRWIVIDMILGKQPENVDDAKDDQGRIVDTVQYCDPVRPTTFVPMPGKRCRWEFMLMPGDDPDEITKPENVFALLAPWKITPADSIVERAVVYTFHSALAAQWRRGRLLLAGDAAHQMPPFLGQGMCSGLRDANNLAWKLRDVVAGKAPDSLLDTYASERAAHVREYIETAVHLASIIQTTDPEKARQRDIDMAANPGLMRPIAPRLGAGLHGDTPAPAGTRAAQPRLPDGTLLDDLVGYNFVLLARADLLASAADARLDLRGVKGVPASGAAAAYLDELGVNAVLIRPDRHILAVAEDLAGLKTAIAKVPYAEAAHALGA